MELNEIFWWGYEIIYTGNFRRIMTFLKKKQLMVQIRSKPNEWKVSRLQSKV